MIEVMVKEKVRKMKLIISGSKSDKEAIDTLIKHALIMTRAEGRRMLKHFPRTQGEQK